MRLKKARRQKGKGRGEQIPPSCLCPAARPQPFCQGRGVWGSLRPVLSIPTTFLSCQLRAGLDSCQLAPWFNINKGAFPSSPPTAKVSIAKAPSLSTSAITSHPAATNITRKLVRSPFLQDIQQDPVKPGWEELSPRETRLLQQQQQESR